MASPLSTDVSLLPETREVFKRIFKEEPLAAVQAPGRVNLIGEHTDYNEGYVLPMAVNRGVALAGRERKDRKVVLHSTDFGQTVEFSLDSLKSDPASRWADYFKGVALLLQEGGTPLSGCEAVVRGDLPKGSGLSSSAALEVASAVFLRGLFRFGMKDLDLVRLTQRAENEFVGVKCGIMDQFASYLSAKGQALFVDCRSLDYHWVPFSGEVAAVVFNTGVKRELASSAYNERRRECEEGVRELAKVLPHVQSLRDVSLCDFEKHQGRLSPTVLRRCRHVVTENQRVLDAEEAFKARDWGRLRVLFKESHDSLRDDYEVSCPELDALVSLAEDCPAQWGSRMTGAGFGGCTVHLLPRDERTVADFTSRVAGGYGKIFGRKPEYYVFEASAGAKFLEEGV